MEAEHVFNGRYRIDGRLGTGGMAIVYSGTDLLLRRRVAIKVLRDQFAEDADFVARFSSEAQAVAKLSHPNIVSVYDFGHEGGTYFIVMELVEGEPLGEVLRGGALPEAVVIDYAIQIAAALAYAHRGGLLHRDVKPANVLVTRDDVVKLSDFGIARVVAENAVAVTQPGMVMGSVAYISPEQAQGLELDERSDLYSLGVVIYHLASGRVPFAAETPVAVALKHVTDAPPPLADVSPALAAIVTRLLQKDRARRFASATDVARALREAREHPALAEPSGDAATTAFTAIPQPPPRRSAAPDTPLLGVEHVRVARAGMPLRTIAAILLAFAFAAIVGYLVIRSAGPARTITVADFAGASATQAQQSLLAAGLVPQVHEEPNDTVAPDRVIRQDPAPGTKVARNAIVMLSVSSGAPLVVVPNVRGFVRADAERALAEAHLRSHVVERFDVAPEHTVIDVTPGVGSRTRVGTVVTLVTSRGLAPIHVPQLVGLALADARAKLEALGLHLNVDATTPSDTIPKDTVASQAQAADATAAPGATIGVTVSSGATTAQVPDVGGKTPSDAQAILAAAGFGMRVQYIVDPTNASGNVVAQDPAAQADAPQHSTVTINIAVAGTVPSVAGTSLEDAKRVIVANGYAIGNVAVTQDGAEGTVVRTEPEADAGLRPGEAVTIYYHPAAPK